MPIRLFVGGVHTCVFLPLNFLVLTLHREIESSQIKDVFREFGEVEEVESGFAGFVFVTMKHTKDGEAAIKSLNNTKPIGGRNINVQEATATGYLTAIRLVTTLSFCA